jgi:hypothetical protein
VALGESHVSDVWREDDPGGAAGRGAQSLRGWEGRGIA